MKIKRIIAYLIDTTIVSLIASTLLLIPGFKYDQDKYQEYYEEYVKSLNTIVESKEELKLDKQYEIMYLMQDLSKSSLVAQAAVSITYFGIIAYLCKGQTLGKKILKIKVVSLDDKEPNLHLFMLRSTILTNFIPTLASIFAIFFLSQKNWIIAETLISNLSLVITFTLILVLIFREDERSLHDLICKTKVIETTSKA